MWNRKHRSYAELAAPHVAKVRYEDLVSDPEHVVSEIQEKFALPSAVSHFYFSCVRTLSGDVNSQIAEGGFANIEDSTKTDKKDYDSYKVYYTSEK